MVSNPSGGGNQRRSGFFLELKAGLVEAVRIFVRYECQNDSGETRRERNERVGEATPEFRVPPEGLYIWNWYRQISAIASTIHEQVNRPIPPSEYLAWTSITGNIVYPIEYDIMFAMDLAYCSEINKEISDRREREIERREREAEAKGRK